MPLRINDYVTSSRIVFIDAADRQRAIDGLVDAADGAAGDMDAFREAVHEREQIVSTGIGLGVAVPHAKLPSISDFFVVIGILRHEIDWDAIDQKPVRMVFLIGGPDDQQQVYLQILSKIVLVTKSPKLRERLLNARDVADVEQAISDI